MKATGIVRKLDNLGRISIPAETRRRLLIKEGDPLEMYVGEGDRIILKKYSVLGTLTDTVAPYAEFLHALCDTPIAICDRDSVIACSGHKTLIGQSITPEVEKIMYRSYTYSFGASETPIYLTEDNALKADRIMITHSVPIIGEGETIGGIAMLGGNTLWKEYAMKLLNSTAKLISGQIGITP